MERAVQSVGKLTTLSVYIEARAGRYQMMTKTHAKMMREKEVATQEFYLVR